VFEIKFHVVNSQIKFGDFGDFKILEHRFFFKNLIFDNFNVLVCKFFLFMILCVVIFHVIFWAWIFAFL